MRPHILLVCRLLMVSCFGVPALASAQDATVVAAGAAEFRISCAVCHGEHARGDGPLAEFLTVKPADLTTLSKQNNGQFPVQQVFDAIDGRTLVRGHGTRDMPVWGARYEANVGKEYGPYGSEAMVRARIMELVDYLQTMQKE